MKTLVIIVFLAFTGLIAGCQKDSTTSPYTPACDGTVKSYATDVAPLISSIAPNVIRNTQPMPNSKHQPVRSGVLL